MKHTQNAIDLLEDIINEFDGKKQVYLSMDRICEIWEELKDSSAPDLLEACKCAFENLKPQGNVKKDFSGHLAIATLSRAIKKAES